jgi:hypothetical protein
LQIIWQDYGYSKAPLQLNKPHPQSTTAGHQNGIRIAEIGSLMLQAERTEAKINRVKSMIDLV